MAKPKDQKKLKPEDVEVEPDAWERFERAMGKMAPKRRPKPVDVKSEEG